MSPTETEELADAIGRIDALARRDAGGRGLAALAASDDLRAAAGQLLCSERVLLVTGFCIRAARIGENDGPAGTLALADALHELGKDVVLITDEHSAGLLAAGATVFAREFPIVVLDRAQALADRQIDELVAAVSPTHVVAIERPGSAPDGHRYSMRGELLDDLVPAADRLLEPPGRRDYVTIAVGDGGNELGFGGLRAALKDEVRLGERIFCSTAADYIVPAGVSNWGALALVATLSLLAGRLLIRPAEHEHAVLIALQAAGAVDGCTRKAEITVDGLAWDDYAATVAGLYETTRSALAEVAWRTND